MLYVDTSVLVALVVNEPASERVTAWYGRARSELASAAWCVTEFGSALGLKSRTGQLDVQQARDAWVRFEKLIANDLRLLPVETADFHYAAMLTLDATTGVRAGDALHLACAARARAKGLVTLDSRMAEAARHMRLKPVSLTP